MNIIENTSLLLGRVLLGVYFLLPGIQKVMNYDGTMQYMNAHDVPFIPLLLPLTIFIQLIAGTAIIIGLKGKAAAFILAGLTLVISIYMHNFWVMPEGSERAHELQNFFKNMGIMAGLLIVSAVGTGRFSLDTRTKNQ